MRSRSASILPDRRHPLPHSARQCLGEAFSKPDSPNPRDIRGHFLPAATRSNIEPKERIAEDGAPWKQQVLRHHVADAVAQAYRTRWAR